MVPFSKTTRWKFSCVILMYAQLECLKPLDEMRSFLQLPWLQTDNRKQTQRNNNSFVSVLSLVSKDTDVPHRPQAWIEWALCQSPWFLLSSVILATKSSFYRDERSSGRRQGQGSRNCWHSDWSNGVYRADMWICLPQQRWPWRFWPVVWSWGK